MKPLTAALFGLLLLAPPVGAQETGEQGAVTRAAQEASVELQSAVAALQDATEARDRIAALTQTIRAYEAGLAALREALRQAALRETTLNMQFNAERAQIAQLIGVLSRLEREPGPLLLLHPSGPLGTVRSGMMLADVTPALQEQALALRTDLEELRDLRQLQIAAGETLTKGLAAATAARSALSKAMSDRTELPKRFTEDPGVLRGLLESADTLEAFASGLAPDDDDPQDFAAAKGRLPLPALGTVLLRPNEADAAGVRRPGLTLATRSRAIVAAPWPATIRYTGPLLNYGNVMILEPGGGYLLVLAGFETVYGEIGEVVAAGAPLGLMGGAEPELADILPEGKVDGGATDTETLYIELRHGADPVDPLEWFVAG